MALLVLQENSLAFLISVCQDNSLCTENSGKVRCFWQITCL